MVKLNMQEDVNDMLYKVKSVPLWLFVGSSQWCFCFATPVVSLSAEQSFEIQSKIESYNEKAG